jgi:hypothetical protein
MEHECKLKMAGNSKGEWIEDNNDTIVLVVNDKIPLSTSIKLGGCISCYLLPNEEVFLQSLQTLRSTRVY